jgi:hypothetical protein
MAKLTKIWAPFDMEVCTNLVQKLKLTTSNCRGWLKFEGGGDLTTSFVLWNLDIDFHMRGENLISIPIGLNIM